METSTRLLRLLSLLQARPDWSGRELAERLEVTTRTIRTDMERLRALGYPVLSSPGVGGGYRLGVGAALPPLLLDDDEAVAVTVGLRTAATVNVSGIDEASVRALVKLEQMLPSRLRYRVNALHKATVAVPNIGPVVDADVLTAIAGAIRASERLRMDYRDHSGASSLRTVEPHRLVRWGRWYLVAWDLDRADWRTFRVDRITPRAPTGPRFAPREPPEGDVTTYVQRGVSAATWQYRARVLLHTSHEHAATKLPPAVSVSPDGPDRCIIEAGSDTPHQLALYLGLLDVDFEVLDPPELVDAFRRLADRYRRASARGRDPNG